MHGPRRPPAGRGRPVEPELTRRLLACRDLEALSRVLERDLPRLIPADEILFDLGPDGLDRPALLRGAVDPAWADRYNREFHAINPALQGMLERLGRDGWLVERFERLCAGSLLKTRFYREYMKPQGHRHTLVGAVASAAVVLLIRRRGAPPFRGEELDRLTLLMPALALAVRVIAFSGDDWTAHVVQRAFRLPRRQAQVAALVAKGLSNKQVAARLGLTVGTVKDYLHRTLEATGCASRSALCRKLLG